MGCDCFEGECVCIIEETPHQMKMPEFPAKDRPFEYLSPDGTWIRRELRATDEVYKNQLTSVFDNHPAIVEAAKLRAMVAELEARNKVLDHELDLVLATVHDVAPDLFVTIMARVERS